MIQVILCYHDRSALGSHPCVAPHKRCGILRYVPFSFIAYFWIDAEGWQIGSSNTKPRPDSLDSIDSIDDPSYPLLFVPMSMPMFVPSVGSK